MLVLLLLSVLIRKVVLVEQRFGVGLVIESSLVRLPTGALSTQLGQLSLFPLRLRVALRGERNRNTVGVSISLAPLATQCNAQL